MNIKPTSIATSAAQVSPEWRSYWNGLQFGTIFDGSRPYNFVGNTYGDISQGGTMGVVTEMGPGYNNIEVSGDAFAYFPYQSRYQLSGDVDWGVFCALDFDSIDTNSGTEAHYVSNDDNTQGSWALYQTAGNVKFSYRAPTTEFRYLNFTNSAPSSGSINFYIRRRIGGKYEIWRNGILIDESINTEVPVLKSSGVLGIGGGGGNLNKDQRNVMGTYLSVYIWKGVAPENSVMLNQDPFGPIRQANRLFLPDLPRSFGSVVVPSDTQRQPITIESSGPTDINISEPPERVINGGFDTDSDWTKETGWTISGGVASQSGGNALSSLYNTISGNIVEGKTYRVTFTVVSITSGQVRVELGGGQAASRGTWRTAAGTYTEILTASSTSYAVKSGDTGNEFTGTVDNVSIKEVDVFTITP